MAFTTVPATSTIVDLELMADALCHAMRLLGGGVRQQAAELLAADTKQEIGRPDAGVDQVNEARQHIVAAGMAEAVVERFEVVEIEEQQAERRALFGVALQQPLAARHEGAAVERAGQRIGLRLGALVEFEALLGQRHQQDRQQEVWANISRLKAPSQPACIGSAPNGNGGTPISGMRATKNSANEAEDHDDRPARGQLARHGRARTRPPP